MTAEVADGADGADGADTGLADFDRPDTGRPNFVQDRWYLIDQRDFLRRSIDDAERELAAGDLSQADFDVLIVRDRERLAEVEADLAALGSLVTAEPPPPGPDVPALRAGGNGRRVGVVLACLLIVAGAIILVNHAVNPALPGQASSGSITASKEQLIEEQLQEADILNNNGEAVPALKLYNKVLSEDPDDPEALAASGWLEWNYGDAGKSAALMAAGRRDEKKTIAVAPTYYAGHLFLGLIILNQDHNAPGAIDEFTKFLSESPPSAELTSVAPLVASAYAEAKQPLPATVAAAIPTTTTTTTAPTTSSP